MCSYRCCNYTAKRPSRNQVHPQHIHNGSIHPSCVHCSAAPPLPRVHPSADVQPQQRPMTARARARAYKCRYHSCCHLWTCSAPSCMLWHHSHAVACSVNCSLTHDALLVPLVGLTLLMQCSCFVFKRQAWMMCHSCCSSGRTCCSVCSKCCKQQHAPTGKTLRTLYVTG